MKIGDKVKHRTRPDVGIGRIVEITDDDLCTVEFETCRFSGVPFNAFGTIEEVEIERLKSEEKELRKQTIFEKQETERIRTRGRQLQKHRALDEQKKQKEFKEENQAKERNDSAIVVQFSRWRVGGLFHITHKDNLQNILRHGILNHYEASHIEPNRVDISDPDAQRWRETKDPHYERSIHSYTPLYINPRNPMLFVRRHLMKSLIILEIDLSVLFDTEYLLSDGNAASRITKFYSSVKQIDELPWAVLHSVYWPDHEDGKRKMCAEVLVYPKVEPSYICAVHCYTPDVQKLLVNCGYKTLVTPKLFF